MTDLKVKVIETLYQELLRYPSNNTAYECLKAICQHTLTQLPNKHNEPIPCTRRQLKELVDGKDSANSHDSRDLGKWIRWKDLEAYLHQFLAQNSDAFASLQAHPVLVQNSSKGGRGNETSFWLAIETAQKNIETDSENEDATLSPQTNPPIHQIDYVRAAAGDIKIAFFLKPFFRRGELLNKSVSGLLFWGPILMSVLLAIIYLVSLAISLVHVAPKYSSMHLFLMLSMCGVFYLYWKDLIWPLWLLPEHRVIKAPTLFLALMEDDAEMEMHKDQHKNKHTRFTRFTATCSLCGSHVFLKTGNPDYALPLVGRCSESPHAHVYGFDRVSLKGTLLNHYHQI